MTGQPHDVAHGRDVPLDLFGFRSPTIRWAIVVFALTYVGVTIGTGIHVRSVFTWSVLAAVFVAFGVAVAMTLGPVVRRISAERASAVVAIVLTACGVGWWRLAADHAEAHQYTPAVAAAIVILNFVAVRGRPLIAAFGTVGLTGVAAINGPTPDWDLGDAFVSTFSGYTVVGLGTLFVIIVRTMENRIEWMRRHAIEAASAEAASDAGAAERNQQMSVLDARARPILRQIVAGHRFTADEVAHIRLVEAQLRDGIRAPAWDTGGVRDAVWAARERGVTVIMLDDGALEQDAFGVRAALAARLVEELSAMTTGRLTARVLPPGRELVASIVIDGGPAAGGSWRIECDVRGDFSRSDEGEGMVWRSGR